MQPMQDEPLRQQLEAIADKIIEAERITPDEALLLLGHERVTPLGALADSAHEWDADPGSWVRAQRRADLRRVG